MRKVAVSEDGVAGVSAFPQPSAGLPLGLAGLFMHEFDTGFLPTTNLMHAGYCQFMRVHEGFCDPHFPLTCFSFLKFPSLPGGKLKPQALSPNEIKDLLLDFDL